MKKIVNTLLMSAILFASCQMMDKPTNDSPAGPSGDPSEEPSENPSEETDFNIVEVIYSDNLDSDDAANHKQNDYFPYLNQWTGYKNATGTGSASVSYSGEYVSIRSSYKSTGYPGASGTNAFFFNRADKYVLIENIKLPENISGKSFIVRFGASIDGTFTDNTTLKLYVICDEEPYDVSYSSEVYGTWNYCTAHFKMNGTVPSDIALKLYSTVSQTRVDDISLSLVTDEATQTLRLPSTESPVELTTPYFECPEILRPSSSQKQVTHYATTYSTKKSVRNYSACYDTERHNPLWVAFPMHSIWHEGGTVRPYPDPWRPDPEFEKSEQSIIYPERWDEWTYQSSWPDGYDTQRWSVLANGKYPGRGHMLASSYRGAGRNDVLFDMNVQTFYPTNVYPEYYKYPKMHSKLELALYDKWKCSDTVYVVIGCHYDDNPVIVSDANWNGVNASASKNCCVPSATYRVFLRTKSGNTGKAVNECQANELTAIGFWLEQSPRVLNTDGSIDQNVTIRDVSLMTVAEIEAKLGGVFSFFPDVPASVKSTYNVSDWTGLSDYVDTPYNQLN
ncbi:MAG: DNA/RNA non-specific endonuclease [Candidatus Cryptobacteroides sp.]